MDIGVEQAQDQLPKVTPIIEIIDPAGDIILNVGDTHHSRVSSKILSLASKPFAAMLGPAFSEGRCLNTTEPPTMDLPEDDGNSMSLICKKLHYQMPQDWNDIWSEKLVVDMAIIVDKYDLKCAIGNHLASGISYLLTETSWWEAEELYHVLIASFILGNAPLFRSVSIALLLGEGNAINVLRMMSDSNSKITSHFPTKAFYVVEYQKAQVRQRVFSQFDRDNGFPLFADLSWLVKTGMILELYQEDIDGRFDRLVEVWKQSCRSLNEVMSAMQDDVNRHMNQLSEDMPLLNVEFPNSAIHLFESDRAALSFALRIKNAIEEARGVTGLCLPCVKAGIRDTGGCDACKDVM